MIPHEKYLHIIYSAHEYKEEKANEGNQVFRHVKNRLPEQYFKVLAWDTDYLMCM
jgi:hypothetical protein